jgi:FkbM family methyltransferase
VVARQGSVIDQATSTARMIWRHPENRGMRGRRLAGWAAWQAWERTVAHPRIVRLHGGLRMVCHPHDHVTSLVLYCGLYDSEEMRFLLAWLRPGDTFLDVGANVAPYSLLATLVDGVSAVAFEPGTLARRRAMDNIRLNGAEEAVRLVPCAVSDSDGEGRLTVDRWATNTLVDADYGGDAETVVMVSLDSFIRAEDGGPISLVKIDVEGHEADVLRGARQLLAKHRPALIVENNDLDALRRFARDNEYTPVAYVPRTDELDRAPWPTRHGGNIILVPDLDEARQRVQRANRPALRQVGG